MTELLSPAGSLSKLKTAIDFGADAVYAAGKMFGLRTASENLSYEELAEGAEYAHSHGARLFVPLNVYPRNDELAQLEEYIAEIAKTGIDAVIVSDLGVFSMVKRLAPNLEIHVSTQANTVNRETANMWAAMGAKRIVLARELSIGEIKGIAQSLPKGIEIEVFVHGAMCVSYSGRCLLSSYLIGRDSNRGDCAQPCRWKYALMEETREGEYFPIEEDKDGTFIMNSKDLCLIKHIPELIESGVTSFKIEGRVKSEFYVATITSAYRRAIDRYLADPKGYVFDDRDYEEVTKVSHRDYCEGFFNGRLENGQITTSSSYIRGYDFVGIVTGWDAENKLLKISQRGKFLKGDTLDILVPKSENVLLKAIRIINEAGEEQESAPHADQTIFIPCDKEIPVRSIVRKAKTVDNQ